MEQNCEIATFYFSWVGRRRQVFFVLPNYSFELTTHERSQAQYTESAHQTHQTQISVHLIQYEYGINGQDKSVET